MYGEDSLDKADDRSQRQSLDERQEQMVGEVSSANHPAKLSKRSMSTASSGPHCAERAPGRRVVSIADQHGDFEGMLDHLQRLGLASTTAGRDKSSWGGLWVGGDAIFVQTGDILDRGPDGKLMYQFLWALQDSALEASPAGQVVLLTGNHELMVLQGDIRYVSNIDFCQYTDDKCGGSPPKYKSYCDDCCTHANNGCQEGWSCLEGNCDFLAAWDKEGEMGKEMRKRFTEGKMKLIYKVNGVVFTHAGLVSSIWPKIGIRTGQDPVQKLNNLTAELFAESSGLELWNSDDVIVAGGGQGGPMWTRLCYESWYTRSGRRRRNGDNKAYYMDSDEFPRVEKGRCQTIRKSLDEISASRMVIGHCPQGPSDGSDGVQTDCSGSIIMADTYMSIAYADTRSSATYNMAALEFFSEDPLGKVSVVYAGRSECASLPDV